MELDRFTTGHWGGKLTWRWGNCKTRHISRRVTARTKEAWPPRTGRDFEEPKRKDPRIHPNLSESIRIYPILSSVRMSWSIRWIYPCPYLLWCRTRQNWNDKWSINFTNILQKLPSGSKIGALRCGSGLIAIRHLAIWVFTWNHVHTIPQSDRLNEIYSRKSVAG